MKKEKKIENISERFFVVGLLYKLHSCVVFASVSSSIVNCALAARDGKTYTRRIMHAYTSVAAAGNGNGSTSIGGFGETKRYAKPIHSIQGNMYLQI